MTTVMDVTTTKFLNMPVTMLQNLKRVALERNITSSEAFIEATSDYLAKHKKLMKEVSL